jgi:hypothetical protein
MSLHWDLGSMYYMPLLQGLMMNFSGLMEIAGMNWLMSTLGSSMAALELLM